MFYSVNAHVFFKSGKLLFYELMKRHFLKYTPMKQSLFYESELFLYIFNTFASCAFCKCKSS